MTPLTLAEMLPPARAAAFVVAVGTKNAARLLEHLTEDEIEHLAAEVAKFGKLSRDLRRAVIEETTKETQAVRYIAEGGINYARDLLVQWKGKHGEEILQRLVENLRITPFSFLRHVDPDALLRFLREEHPQTIALVLAHQSASYASHFLAGLDPELQTEVAFRIATMGRTSPEVVHKLEQALQLRVGSVRTSDLAGGGGVRALANILNNSDRGTEKAILEHLSVQDQALAEQVRALMFVFEDITILDNHAIQEVLKHIESSMLAMALKGVRDDVRDAVYRNMSERARVRLEEEIDLLGPVHRRDVEGAQAAIAARVRELDEEGVIVVSRGGEGEILE